MISRGVYFGFGVSVMTVGSEDATSSPAIYNPQLFSAFEIPASDANELHYDEQFVCIAKTRIAWVELTDILA